MENRDSERPRVAGGRLAWPVVLVGGRAAQRPPSRLTLALARRRRRRDNTTAAASFVDATAFPGAGDANCKLEERQMVINIYGILTIFI